MLPRESAPHSDSQSGRGDRPQGGKKNSLLGNHQSSWIWGKHLVRETLEAGRWQIHELILASDPGGEELIRFEHLCPGLKPLIANRKRLTQLCGAEDHQGWLARVGPFPYVPVGELLTHQPTRAFLLLIEGIQDSYNLGTILRSAEVFGVTGVCLGKVGQTGINSLAARSSVGAVNRLRISQTVDLIELMRQLRQTGLAIIGTSPEAESSVDQIDLTGGVAIVVGNEGRGLSPEALAACTHLAKIPQPGLLNSLNAAAATAIVCYEVQRQRRQSIAPE